MLPGGRSHCCASVACTGRLQRRAGAPSRACPTHACPTPSRRSAAWSPPPRWPRGPRRRRPSRRTGTGYPPTSPWPVRDADSAHVQTAVLTTAAAGTNTLRRVLVLAQARAHLPARPHLPHDARRCPGQLHGRARAVHGTWWRFALLVRTTGTLHWLAPNWPDLLPCPPSPPPRPPLLLHAADARPRPVDPRPRTRPRAAMDRGHAAARPDVVVFRLRGGQRDVCTPRAGPRRAAAGCDDGLGPRSAQDAARTFLSACLRARPSATRMHRG